MRAIVAQRAPENGGPYRSLGDFCERTRVSVEIVENLVRVGAFDALGVRREELLVQVPLIHARVMGLRPGSAQRSPSDAVGLPRWARWLDGGRRAGRGSRGALEAATGGRRAGRGRGRGGRRPPSEAPPPAGR